MQSRRFRSLFVLLPGILVLGHLVLTSKGFAQPYEESAYFPIVFREAAALASVTPQSASATPSATPAPAVTPVPGEVSILPNYYTSVDNFDFLRVTGEVHNGTDDNLRFVGITANFFDSGHRLVKRDFTYTYLSRVPAGTTTCFEIALRRPTTWTYFQFERPTYWTNGEPLPRLTVVGDRGVYDPETGWYEVTGQVRNDDGAPVENVSPVVTLYNASGSVVGCSAVRLGAGLEPGKSGSFELQFLSRDYSNVASYRIQVDATAE